MVIPLLFYRIAAAASWVSAITTCLLIFLPRFFAAGEGFEARMARVDDPMYELRSWVYFFHPFFVMTAALGVAVRLRRVAPALVMPGLLGFLAWGGTEAAQQTLTLMTFDRWRRLYLAGDELVRSTMHLRTALYDDLWDAMFLFLLTAFLIGNTLYAIAMWRGSKLAKAVSIGYVGAVALTAIEIVSLLGGPRPPPILDAWLYPALQPLARALTGVWLWRNATSDSMASDYFRSA